MLESSHEYELNVRIGLWIRYRTVHLLQANLSVHRPSANDINITFYAPQATSSSTTTYVPYISSIPIIANPAQSAA